MGVHKLTAGDGYTYLTRQVAAHDSTERGHCGLSDYYSEKGESPGRWVGAGLSGLAITAGGEVTEQQMRNLFGQGRHPDAEALEDAALDAGATVSQADRASRLGRQYAVHTGASGFQQEAARRFSDHNLDGGLHWKTPLPDDVRARIRTQVADETFTAEHGRGPADDRERSGWIAKASRQPTTAVAGYDLCFTPVKSISTLWAVADDQVSAQVAQAHDSAVAGALAYLEDQVLFTRRGRAGVQQVKAAGLIAAAFTHRDARSGDPNLHTHVAVANKVQDATGRWLTVDGRVLYKANVTVSELYNTLIEAELVARLGCSFAPREHTTGPGKRAVRELLGVDPRLAAAWSSRATAIETRRRELAMGFQDRHHRPPTAVEAIALAQQANLDTRQAKHRPRSEADQRTQWRAEAETVLGGATGVEQMVAHTIGIADPSPATDTARWVDRAAGQVVAVVSAHRATWQTWHLRAEALRLAREHPIGIKDLRDRVDEVVAMAVAEHCVPFSQTDPLADPGVGPTALQRADGHSVYRLHESREYTSPAIVTAERTLLAAAGQTGARRISDMRVGIAVAETAANGIALNAAQEALVRGFTTSGRRLQLALAPAGTGKTTAMEVLARAWFDAGGQVVGLAPSAVAASQLRAALNAADPTRATVCDTLTKLTWSLEPGHHTPTWVDRIDAKTMVIIDEAAMASTLELATAVSYVLDRGGCVRLVGDDRQLAAIAAGGVLRDIATTHGAITLTEVRRFTHPAEAAATIAVRDGDPAALGFYADHRRIHVGDLTTAADQAYRAWTTDTAAGKHSLLLAPTRQLVAELNTRARGDRLAAHPHQTDPLQTAPQGGATGRSVGLGDGTSASAGDIVMTRRNDRGLRVSRTDWVKNGDRWTVVGAHSDGGLTVAHPTLRRRHVRLPAAYVQAGHVQLGYACTIHAAQGTNVDTCHTVLAGTEDRALLYVATSRGRASNHIYLSVATDGDPHSAITPDALIPPTAMDHLTRILDRDTSPTSATTTARNSQDPALLLYHCAARYHDAVTFAAEQMLSPVLLDCLDQDAERLHDGLTGAPAWPTLRTHLALLAHDGHDPVALLRETVTRGTLAGVDDPAAVLDARLDPHTPRLGTVAWLPTIPAGLAADLDWGPYLQQRSTQLDDLVEHMRTTSQAWTPTTAPPWARQLLGPEHAGLLGDLAVWRAIQHIPHTDTRPTGPHQIGTPGQHQKDLNRRTRTTIGTYGFAQRSWYLALPQTLHTDPWFTPLCQHLARLERAGLPVADYLVDALTEARPLPDEHAAAALWWRIAGHLGPAAVHDTGTGDLLRPAWSHILTDLVTPDDTENLIASPTWPALVAAVDEAAHRHHWDHRTLLTTANQALPTHLTPADRCEALLLRVAMLTDPPDHEHDQTSPVPVRDEDELPPSDLDHLPAPTWVNEIAVVDPARNIRELHAPLATQDDTQAGHPGSLTASSSSSPRRARAVAATSPARQTHDRAVALNEAALTFFADSNPRSWVPGYLHARLGTDLVDHPHTVVGYAPPGPTSLLRHLTAHGATTDELLAIGLVKRRERGDLVDVFKDRMVMPIRNHHGHVVGFVGRRNPGREDDRYAGPKYLNTRTTDLYSKGNHLFGLTETHHALACGAVPVIVEGPIDAWSITLGSNYQAVGVASLGTALTPTQTALLRPHFHTNPNAIAIATDADAPGWAAAQTQFWHLTAAGADPTTLTFPNGVDPASAYQHDTSAIRAALQARRPLGEIMIEEDLRSTHNWTHPASRMGLVKRAGQILAARPIETWEASIGRLNARLHLSPGVLEHEVLHHSSLRDPDYDRYAAERVEELNKARQHRPRTVTPTPQTSPNSASPSRVEERDPTRRRGPAHPEIRR